MRCHLGLYAADQTFDLSKMATEIAAADLSDDRFHRAAWAGGAGRDLDRRHGPPPGRAAVAAPAPACLRDRTARSGPALHAVETRLWEPTIMAGIYAWLILYRLLARQVGARTRLSLGGVAGSASRLRCWPRWGRRLISGSSGVDPVRVLSANWSLVSWMRPAVIVWGYRRSLWRSRPAGARIDRGAAASFRLRLLWAKERMLDDRGRGAGLLRARIDGRVQQLPAGLRDAINYAPGTAQPDGSPPLPETRRRECARDDRAEAAPRRRPIIEHTSRSSVTLEQKFSRSFLPGNA